MGDLNLAQMIHLQKIKDNGYKTASAEDILLLQEWYPLYVVFTKITDAQREVYTEEGRQAPSHAVTIVDQYEYDATFDSEDFSIDAVDLLGGVTHACREIWQEELEADDEGGND